MGTALQYLQKCINLKRLTSDLDEASKLPLTKNSDVSTVLELVVLLKYAFKFALKRRMDEVDEVSAEIDLNQLARFCRIAYNNTCHVQLLFLEGIALFHGTPFDKAVNEECISVLERAVIKDVSNASLYLGLSFQRNYRLTRRETDRKLAAQHLETVTNLDCNDRLIGFLFEKGYLMDRDSQRLSLF